MTPNNTKLVERLTAPIPQYEQDVRIVDGRVLANPDGPEAAAVIEDLVKALSGTLSFARLKWGNLDPDANFIFAKAEAAVERARA